MTYLKATCIILLISSITVSCSQKFNITDHFDPALPFEVMDAEKPGSDGSSTVIRSNDLRHQQLVSWLNSNDNGWKKTEHNTHAGLVIVTQGEFTILLYRDNDFVVAGYNDEEDVMQQYIRKMDSNELRFLVDD